MRDDILLICIDSDCVAVSPYLSPFLAKVIRRRRQRVRVSERCFITVNSEIFARIPFSRITLKVRKTAKIRNRYNQAPHLTQDTNGKVTTSQLDIANESQEVSPFPSRYLKASINA